MALVIGEGEMGPNWSEVGSSGESWLAINGDVDDEDESLLRSYWLRNDEGMVPDLLLCCCCPGSWGSIDGVNDIDGGEGFELKFFITTVDESWLEPMGLDEFSIANKGDNQ